MAEIFFTPVIEILLQLLTKEVKSVTEVRKEVATLKEELELIQSLVKDADTRSNRGELSEALKTWVKQLREAAYHVEDVIDEYRSHVAQGTTNKSGFMGFLYKIGHRLKSLKSRYPIASKLHNVQESLQKIRDRGQGYGLHLQETRSNTTYVEGYDPQLDSLFIEEDEFVDVHSMQKKIVGNLIEGSSARILISLEGQGGIGKTTLAKRVFENEMVKTQFDCRAWITVSQSYNMEELVNKMKRQLYPTKASSTGEIDGIEQLICSLREYLQTKRYIVIFDDIWDTNILESMRHALPNNTKGSRILITTRNTTIAANCKEHPSDVVHELKIWSQELAWELFCKKAFRFESDKHCPEEVKKTSLEIVGKCQGLPIVIAAIAGMLSTKKKVEFEWKRVLDNLNFEFETNPRLSRISGILSLSYYDLPYHVKPCFLYLGIFPEDYLIDGNILRRLWITEGFIIEKKDKTLENVAQEYLNELINRNLVSFETRGGVDKVCKVHDLMREIILSKAKESCFLQIFDEGKKLFGGKSRRISIYGSTKGIVEAIEDIGVRSISFFNLKELSTSSLVTFFKKFKFLKLLNLSDAPLDHLPEEVGNLFHLKYLSLKGTNIKMVPKSIGKLHDLQTLNLSHTSVHDLPKSIAKLQNLQSLILARTPVQELPIEINKLQSLRFLIGYSFNFKVSLTSSSLSPYSGVKIYGEVGSLQSLEVRRNVELDPCKLGLIKNLDKLTNLRELGISKVTKEIGRVIFTSVEKMDRLERLELLAISVDEILDLQSNISFPYLQTLILHCRLEKFPNWISKLWSLKSLNLGGSRLNVDPLEYLKSLPNLTWLTLLKTYEKEQLHFEEGSFQNLKEFYLIGLESLNLVIIDYGETNSTLTLPCLEFFLISSCPQLKELPSGIQNLKNLKRLEIEEMPKEFVIRLQPKEGLDYFKIKHVPFVRFGYYMEGTRDDCTFYNLGQPELLERLREH